MVFTGIEPPRGPIYDHVFGWAAETPEGWIGRVMTAHVGVATQDLPGFAEGATRVVPRGTANTVNGYTGRDGVRASTVCLASVTKGHFVGSAVELEGELTHTENPLIFQQGAPIRIEGSVGSGEFTFTIRAAGRDREVRCTGLILAS